MGVRAARVNDSKSLQVLYMYRPYHKPSVSANGSLASSRRRCHGSYGGDLARFCRLKVSTTCGGLFRAGNAFSWLLDGTTSLAVGISLWILRAEEVGGFLGKRGHLAYKSGLGPANIRHWKTKQRFILNGCGVL
jgi:hypothetical protein